MKNGKVTAKKKGTAKITATVGGKKLTCKVTVKAKANANTGGSASKDSPKLSRTKLTLKAGKKATLKVTNAQGKVTWKSSNKKVATVKNGKVTAKKKGTAKITATVGGKKLICKVTVKAKTGTETKYKSANMEVGRDIPAGTYALIAQGSELATYGICLDADYQSTLSTGIFFGNTYVKLEKGQYMYMDSCYAVPESQAEPDTNKSGVFKVGKDIAAGTYKLSPSKGDEGMYYVYSSLNDLMYTEIEISDMTKINGSESVELKKGQYLQTIDCKIAK